MLCVAVAVAVAVQLRQAKQMQNLQGLREMLASRVRKGERLRLAIPLPLCLILSKQLKRQDLNELSNLTLL